MTRLRSTLGLCLVLTLLVSAAWLSIRERAPKASLESLSDISRLEVTFKHVDASFTKTAQIWKINTFNGKPVRDSRANQSLVSHLVSVVRAMKLTEYEALNTKDAPALTSNSFLSIRWEDEPIVIGNRDVSGRLVYVHLPRRELLTQVRGNVLLLMEPREPLDLRDRRLTTFEIDDVEDLMTSKDCGDYKLARDGDRWQWQSPKPPHKLSQTQSTEAWLESLLRLRYDEIEEPSEIPNVAASDTACVIELKGRRGKAETITLFRRNGDLWAVNSQLPAVYRAPKDILNTVVKGAKRTEVPKSAAGS